jgi:hypothetical protein
VWRGCRGCLGHGAGPEAAGVEYGDVRDDDVGGGRDPGELGRSIGREGGARNGRTRLLGGRGADTEASPGDDDGPGCGTRIARGRTGSVSRDAAWLGARKYDG